MEKPIKSIFQQIEEAFLASLTSIEINDEVYACGFWLFYCDYTVINPPCFGYNSSYEEDEDRWAPPEWDIDIDDAIYNALSPLYEKLSHLMDNKSDEEWERLIEYQWQFYSELCSKLNSELYSPNSPFKNWPKKSNFVIGIFEERESEEIYEKLAIDSLGYEKAKELCVI